MPSIEILITFSLAALLLNLSPGPSNLYVLARTIAQGTRGGMVAAAGLAVGSLVHVVAAALGLSVIFSQSPALYTGIKLAGAAYLIYLGLGYWRSRASAEVEKTTQIRVKSLRAVFLESILVEVTNPKTALFFIALLPQFVAPESGPVSQQLLILGIIVTLSALPCDALIAVSTGKASAWLMQNKRGRQLQERVSGSILLAMGMYIVADEIAGPGR